MLARRQNADDMQSRYGQNVPAYAGVVNGIGINNAADDSAVFIEHGSPHKKARTAKARAVDLRGRSEENRKTCEGIIGQA